MLVVIALGGNALLRRGEPPDAETQRRHVRDAVAAIAAIAASTTWSSPTATARRSACSRCRPRPTEDAEPYPLDVLGAESEGEIGYLIEQELANALGEPRVATLLTQVVVDADDPAFATPTKPIGPVFDRERGARLAAERGWTMAPDGDGVRRVVPSPEPQRILELATIAAPRRRRRHWSSAPAAAASPSRLDERRLLRGVEAVIDKDLASGCSPASSAPTPCCCSPTCAAVEAGWGTRRRRRSREISAAELASLDLAAGTIGPKVEAACRFAERTGRLAAIGALEDAAAILAGEAGTRVTSVRERTP